MRPHHLHQHRESGDVSLPLMRKTFIEAGESHAGQHGGVVRLFRLCGRLSLRLKAEPAALSGPASLPLMRKTFIEASCSLHLVT